MAKLYKQLKTHFQFFEPILTKTRRLGIGGKQIFKPFFVFGLLHVTANPIADF